MAIKVTDAQPLAGLAACAADSLSSIRRDEPRVHCLTNTVAQTLTANLLLSVGASPAMSLALDEIDQLVAGSAALVVNLGTLDEARRAAMSRAVRVAGEHRIPWVLDPVMVERSPARLSFARELLAHRPTVVRGNAPEIAALVTALGPEADPGALAKDIGTVVAQTGPTDLICDASRSVSLTFGHPLMPRVTGLGCALSALLAAFCAVETDPFAAAAQGLLAFGIAGEMAAETATGPGSFQTALLDRLYTLDAVALTVRGRGP
jgi:hydroxyethylthiazole kinase